MFCWACFKTIHKQTLVEFIVSSPDQVVLARLFTPHPVLNSNSEQSFYYKWVTWQGVRGKSQRRRIIPRLCKTCAWESQTRVFHSEIRARELRRQCTLVKAGSKPTTLPLGKGFSYAAAYHLRYPSSACSRDVVVNPVTDKVTVSVLTTSE